MLLLKAYNNLYSSYLTHLKESSALYDEYVKVKDQLAHKPVKLKETDELTESVLSNPVLKDRIQTLHKDYKNPKLSTPDTDTDLNTPSNSDSKPSNLCAPPYKMCNLGINLL